MDTPYTTFQLNRLFSGVAKICFAEILLTIETKWCDLSSAVF